MLLATDTSASAALSNPVAVTATADTVTPLDPAVTAARLGKATLAYLVGMTLVVTLTPFRFAHAPVQGLTSIWTWDDIVLNVVMFLPLGFLFGLTRRSNSPVVLAGLLGTALSGAIEFAQLFESERFPSLLDVAANGAGAAIGAFAWMVATRRLSNGSSQVRTMALELPLMGLVYLLIPLLWLVALSSPAGARVSLVLPVAAFGGAILGAVHGGYLVPARQTSLRALIVATAAWFSIAGVMVLRKHSLVFASGLVLSVVVALLQSHLAARVRTADRNRRFELPTLRIVMPLFAAYLALAALWPLDGADLHWRSELAFFPAHVLDMNVQVYRALEHIAAFTLVGYLIAEVHGRDDRPYSTMIPRLIIWGGGIAFLLEAARGVHATYGASLLLWLLASAASLLGGVIYHLQRDHVRAIVGAR